MAAALRGPGSALETHAWSYSERGPLESYRRHSMREACLPAQLFALACVVALSGDCAFTARTDGAGLTQHPVRTVHLEREFALAAVTSQIEISQTAPARATGRVRIRTGDVNRSGVEQAYGCQAQEVRDRGFPEWLCSVEFGGPEPDWVAIMGELDAAGIMAPPRDPPRPQMCVDGAPWTLVVYTGTSNTPVVEERQLCDAITSRRKAFEAVVESVIDRILRAASERTSRRP